MLYCKTKRIEPNFHAFGEFQAPTPVMIWILMKENGIDFVDNYIIILNIMTSLHLL